MRSLRVRLMLWFTLGFALVITIQAVFTYRYLDRQLRRDSFQREEKINPDWIIHGSYTETEIDDIMGQMLRSSLVVSLPLVLLVLVLGYVIARQSLKPIEKLNVQLKEVTPGTLGRKVELAEGDEQFRSLQGHLNDMLARLDSSFAEMSEYAAKVAHELRTPISIMRHRIEQAEGRIDPELAEQFQEELLRLGHVVDQSLLIARAGQGRLEWTMTRFDFVEVVNEIVGDFRLLAAEQDRKLEWESTGPVWVESDVRLCKQMLHVWFNNALVHGRGEVRCRVKVRGSRLCFLLWNRIRQTERVAELSLGLGLRVVRALVAHQTSVTVRNHSGKDWYAVSLRMLRVTVAGGSAPAGAPANSRILDVS